MRAVATVALAFAAALLVEGCSTAGSETVHPGATKDPHSPYATTRAEFYVAVKACLQDRGFEVDVDVAQGAIYTHETTDARTREAVAAINECETAIDPLRDGLPPKPGPDELHAWYVYVVAQVKCYRAAGYPVPDPPPEQVFVDAGGYWDPAGKLVETTGQAVPPDAARRCQAIPERPSFFDW